MNFLNIMDNGPNSKIQKLLRKLLDPLFDITETELGILFKHLPELCADKSIGEDFFIFWFKSFTEIWKATQQNISTKAVLIVVNIAGILCREEQTFLNLNFTGIVDEILCIIKSLPEIQTVAYMQQYYIYVMNNFLKHKSGLQWLIASNHWHDIFALTLKKTDKLVFKEGCIFLKELLNKSKTDNEIFCNNVVILLVAPLRHFSRRTNLVGVMDYNEACLDAKKRLKILKHIFKQMLPTSCAEKDFKFMDIMQEKFKIDDILEELTNTEQPKDMYFQLYIIQCLIAYFNVAKELKDYSDIACSKTTQLNMFEGKLYNIFMKASIAIDEYYIILELIHENVLFMYDLSEKMNVFKSVAQEYEYQILAFLFIPLRRNYCNLAGNCKHQVEDEFKEELSVRLTRKFLPITFQAAVKIKKRSTLADALASFKYIQNYAASFNHQTIICFAQIAVYFFGDTVRYVNNSKEPLTESLEAFILGLLETMIYLFTEFDLSWKDGIETIYVRDDVVEFLILDNISTKLITRALQLLNVAVRKNLSPDLHLLIDESQEGYAPCIRDYFIPFINHTDWEIRNASVQVIHANVQTKKEYITTTKTMLEFNFSERILNMIASDPETTVRISALRCFRDTVNVADVWESISKVPDFYDKILQMFYLESDGIVRSEVVGLITSIYEHHNLPDMTEKFYDIMSYSVLEDECWEVKLSALGFWKKVIDNHLTDEGMIDGEFPTVTFSKKFKKIITFDDYAIKMCLERVLNKLSNTRCIAAFLFALNSPSRSSLEQTALKLLMPFIKLMKKHYFLPSPLESPLRTSFSFSDSGCSSPRPSVSDSPHSTNSLFSSYPDSLYEDIIDMQESLVSDSNFLDTIFKDSVLDSPETVLLDEFVKYIEHFDCCYYDRAECNDIDKLLKTLLR